MRESLRFEPLTKNNKDDWFSVASRCSYAPINAVDESLIDLQLTDKRSAGVILYDENTGTAIGIFPGEMRTKRVGPVRLNSIQSRFGGLLVPDDWLDRIELLKKFFFRKVMIGYFKKKLKIDY